MRPLYRFIDCPTLRAQVLSSVSNYPKVVRLNAQSVRQHHGMDDGGQRNQYHFRKWLPILGASCLTLLAWNNKDRVVHAFNFNKTDGDNYSNDRNIFTKHEVSQHNSLDKGIWITYKGNVYDITKFVKHHPGGSHTIMMGAGGDVEPFWETYTVHKAKEVQDLLAQYQIGVLDPVELSKEQRTDEKHVEEVNDPYASDPKRNSLLKVLSAKPFNAETPAELLTQTYLTPVEIFFVRNHLPVPEVDLADYKLSICLGTDGKQDDLKILAEFTLDDLKTKFKSHSVDSVIQCSGNRRSDLKQIKEIKGLDWRLGAIGNARWTGVRLNDVLDHLGFRSDNLDEYNIKHVQMEGLDCDMSGQSYGASISSDLVFDPKKDILLAYEMNGQPLTRDHGFPLRLVAPGVTGARNVKWLNKIILSHEESHSHWQRKDYKSFSPNVDMFNVNFDESASVQETPVQSAICEPQDGAELNLKLTPSNNQVLLPVSGYAYSGSGKLIIRVDVSVDGGQNWITAKLADVPRTDNGLPDYTMRNQHYSWTRWTADIPIPSGIVSKKGGNLEVLCRAFDSSYNSQPERPETIWNVRGVLNNSWHRVRLNIKLQ